MSGSPQHRRVAIVANSIWNLRNFRSGLAHALMAAGHEVLLVAPPDEENGPPPELPATFLSLQHLRRSGMNPMRDLALAYELNRLFARHRVDVCLLFTIKPVIYGSFAARLSGTQSIATLTGLGYTFLSGVTANKLVRTLYRAALQSAAKVFFHNDDDRQEFIADGLVAQHKTRTVGGSGIDIGYFSVAPFTEADPGHFLFIGRLLTDKGIREYVAASRSARTQNPSLTFHIVGGLDPGNPTGVLREELAAWVADGHIVYHGEAKDVRPFLRKASVVVLPSYREGLPRILVEAGATARPLLATDVPGCRAVVTDSENGFLVPARDVEALAAAMLKMAALPPEDLRKMGLRARAVVQERFDQRLVSEAYLAAVEGG